MSLIQQALEKTRRAAKVSASQPGADKLLLPTQFVDTHLEEELVRVQREHASRRVFYRNLVIGMLLFCVLGIIFLLFQRPPASHVKTPYAATRQTSPRIFFGGSYRLTGITKINGVKMAVINDEIVGVGDLLSNKGMVKEIGDQEVLLDLRGQKIRLTL